ncbi:hypothetical protein CEE37_01330 [candidate division LCP-89 bacterium B3_LCP]|uniref:Fibronectin type-III domain-containing protein n=1 Tax=candidate division LCP-89 bacterium B3_LCP TaxID=2012998 RepID=A0A532V589_UNCL8|nr:MAG: hypothetical protein CEE37_01330 [candidate division LCP-89 bacterium B3_LCP]
MLISCLVILVGCGREEIAADLIPPEDVLLTVRSADTSLVEEGIDAVPGGHYIYLSWLASPADDLAGYRVFRQTQDSADFDMVDEVDAFITEYEDHDPILAPNQITGLTLGFSYWVVAFDEAGNVSNLSDEATYRLMPTPVLSPPVVQGDSLVFSWSYNQYDPLDFSFYVIRLFQQQGSDWIPIWIYVHNVPFPLEAAYYSVFLSAGTYKYQVDVVGAPLDLPAGSEADLEFAFP